MGKMRGDDGGEELVRSRVRGRGAVLLIWRGKGGRGVELAVAEGAPLLCTFGVRRTTMTSSLPQGNGPWRWAVVLAVWAAPRGS